jgi:hypothetical protein
MMRRGTKEPHQSGNYNRKNEESIKGAKACTALKLNRW